MCVGCGACAGYRPEVIEMKDVPDFGARPFVDRSGAGDRAGVEALAVCPGVRLERRAESSRTPIVEELYAGWGAVLEVWEGHASDADIRFAGSSGGAATALALASMEQAGMHGTAHIRARKDRPYLNETVLSMNREGLLEGTGSRYAPASPCEALPEIEAAPDPCVFIGKPCDVAGAEMVRQSRSLLDARLGLTIAIFCAGTPSTNGTMALLRKMGIRELASVRELRYRGRGWPGRATVVVEGEDGTQRRVSESYSDSWGLLQGYRQWRCYVCADHTGEFADIAVGDPWYRGVPDDAPGQSLILVRTERGRRHLRMAIDAGYLEANQVDHSLLPASQPELLKARGSLLGRIFVSRLMGAASPNYSGFAILRYFLSELTIREKLQSFLGTARRVMVKRLRVRRDLLPREPRLDGS
jgi:coenzyme F420 hydrogenase subunit beta